MKPSSIRIVGRTLALAVVALVAVSRPSSAQTYDFSQNNGGFTLTGQFDNWGYDAVGGHWRDLHQVANDNRLLSPTVTAAGGAATMSLTHTFAFDGFTNQNTLTCWDGGIVRMSVNGGAYTTISPNAGQLYNGTISTSAPNANPMPGSPAFCGAPPNPGSYVTSSWALSFNPGDQVQFSFDASWGYNGRSPSESWFLSEVDLTGFGNVQAPTPTTTPEPSSLALLGSGLVGLVPMMRRYRA